MIPFPALKSPALLAAIASHPGIFLRIAPSIAEVYAIVTNVASTYLTKGTAPSMEWQQIHLAEWF